MQESPAKQFVGKFLFFYTPLYQKVPQFIDDTPAKVTAAKAERQMYLEIVKPGDHLDKSFTRVGDHIAKVCDTFEQCEEFRTRLRQYKAQIEAMNKTLMESSPITHTRVRTA